MIICRDIRPANVLISYQLFYLKYAVLPWMSVQSVVWYYFLYAFFKCIIEIFFSSHHRYYIVESLNQWPCLRNKLLPYWHVRFSVYFPTALSMIKLKTMKIFKIQISISKSTYGCRLFHLLANHYCFRLYQRGPPEKIEKLRCILHYFHRIEEKSEFRCILSFYLFYMINLVPTGVISFRRFVLTKEMDPNWSKSSAPLSGIHITSDKKIEDISCTLQVIRTIHMIHSRFSLF